MKVILSGLLMVAALVANVAAQAPTATPTQAFGVDYLDADMTTYAVTRFEIQVDGGAFTSVGIPPKQNDMQTPAGGSTYKIAIPPMTPGSHTVGVRVCNVVTCSTATPLSFTFSITPVAPPTPRIIGG